MRAMRPFTPAQLAPTNAALRALAALDDVALAATIDDRVPPSEEDGWLARIWGRQRRARREARAAWLREAIAPWRSGGGGSRQMRTDGRLTLARFSQRGDEVLVVVVDGREARRVVRVLPESVYDTFGTLVT